MKKNKLVSKKTLEDFGILVGGLLLLFALWPLLRQFHGAFPFRFWVTICGSSLIWIGLLFPQWLSSPYALWMWVGEKLGWLNTRIILGMIFYILFTPISILFKMIAYDPMRRKFDKVAQTYKLSVKPRKEKHCHQQF